MTSIVNTRTFFQAQSKIVQKIYTNSAPFKPLRYPGVFNNYGGDDDRSFFQMLSLVGFGTLAEKTEGQIPMVDSPKEGLLSMFPYYSYALRYAVTKEMQREDAKHLIPKLPGMLRYSSDQTKEFLFWNVFNLAFNSAVTLADGQALISTSHPLQGSSAQPGINSYSNSLGAVSLTPDTLQQAYVLMADMPDDRGLVSYRTPQQLIYPLGLDQTAKEVLGSSYYPNSDENRINVVAGSVQPMPIEYLTAPGSGPFPWFVLAGKGDPGTDSHTVFANVKWDEQRAYYDEPTQAMIHETEFRSVWGAVNGRGIVGSQGA